MALRALFLAFLWLTLGLTLWAAGFYIWAWADARIPGAAAAAAALILGGIGLILSALIDAVESAP